MVVCLYGALHAFIHLSGFAGSIKDVSSPSDEITNEALPGVLGIQGEGLFIFRDLGRRVIYFQGFGEILGV